MMRSLNEVRLDRMVEVINNSATEHQRRHRAKLFLKLTSLVEEANRLKMSEAQFYVHLYQEPHIWVLAFIDDEQGRPLFLSPWQCSFWAMYFRKRRLMGLMSRKVGKTTMLAAILSWLLCGPQPIRAVAFSPSEGQSFIYDKCRTYVTRSEYLNETFMSGSDSHVTDRELVSSVGSSIHKGYVSQNTKGEQARGQYGDVIVVDEVQSIAKEILDEIIEPMVADSFSEPGNKKLIYIGTPHTARNPELPEMWKRYRAKSLSSDEYGTFSIDCWGGVEEGCIDEEFVKEQEDTMHADVFAREYLAVFPNTSDSFCSKSQIMASVDRSLTFGKPSMRDKSAFYALAVDWARHRDRTQIVVAKLDKNRKTIKYVDWSEFDHSKESDTDYKHQVKEVLRLFWQWGCKMIIPDSSGTQDMVIDWLRTGIEGYRGIPDNMIYGFKNGKREQSLGFKATRELNYNMYINHKTLIANKQIIIPGKGKKESLFLDRFIKEHTSLVTIETAQGIKYEKPKRGYKDLVSACAMMSLLMEKKVSSPASTSVVSFGHKKKPLSARW